MPTATHGRRWIRGFTPNRKPQFRILDADTTAMQTPDLTTAPRWVPGHEPYAAPARPAEPQRRLLGIRVPAAVALAVGAVYLTWRLTATLNDDAVALSLVLWLLELHAWIGLGLFTFSLWDVDGAPVPTDEVPDLRVAVLIPTYDEPVEILLPTIAAALVLQPAHETWVLDDGNRPAVAALARRLGAQYLTRTEHVDAKAGNLNHALTVVDADVVAVLDADHVAKSELLLRTLPYFADPEIALVQTPQDFYNETSFEHVHATDRDHAGETRVVYSEQALFYREIQPGKNRWNGAFWCGTGAVVRTCALASVGGVATSSVTEDIQTTIRMHRRGWRTVYHDEVLARGLAAATAAQYSLQRHRWCTGAMQVLREERPLTDRRLTLPQRLTYAATMLGWFDAVRVLGFLLLPPTVLLTGASPIDASLVPFLVLFLCSLALQQHALWRLGRGRIRVVPAAVFDLVRLEPTLRAIVGGLTGRAGGFAVTPKGRTAAARSHAPTPRLLAAVLAAHVVALGWYLLNVTGPGPMTYGIPGVAHGASFWAIVNGTLVVLAIRRVRAERYAAERRASHRHEVVATGTLDGRQVTITDLSITGAQAIAPSDRTPEPGSAVTVTVVLDVGETTLRATVRSMRPEADGLVRIGVEFVADQLDEQARLTVGLFAAGSRSRKPRDAHARTG
jgi:cellulose synthase/poly-beta-1,6-N-acetylglucosamine synthase-like glycosyltransferase